MSESYTECHLEYFQMKGRPSSGIRPLLGWSRGRAPLWHGLTAVLSPQLRGDLQTAFPCEGLVVEWRGKRRT